MFCIFMHKGQNDRLICASYIPLYSFRPLLHMKEFIMSLPSRALNLIFVLLTINSVLNLPCLEETSFMPAIQIMLSGDCHPYPGPNYKFPCGMCQGPCKSNQNRVAYDSCDTWFHVKCMNMPLAVFHAIKNTSWVCFTCGIPNFSTTFLRRPTTVIRSPNR